MVLRVLELAMVFCILGPGTLFARALRMLYLVVLGVFLFHVHELYLVSIDLPRLSRGLFQLVLVVGL